MSAQNKHCTNPVRVMIVEDYKLARVGLKYALLEFEDIEVTAEAESGEEAVRIALTQSPDVILMDLGLPGINGLEATVQIKEKYPHIKVIVLTSHELEEDIHASFAAGATGYCLKNIEPKALLGVIKTVYTGACWIDPSVTKTALKCFTKIENFGVFSFKNPENKIHLTTREREILALVVKGKNNMEIAKDLIISPHTAKAHVCNIMHKLNVEDRTQAAVKAIQENLI